MNDPARQLDLLLVEDNDDDVMLVREALAEAPRLRLVHVAPHGDAAIAWLRQQLAGGPAALPHLVLLDLNMPRRNGFEVLADLQADPRLARVPVVVLTTSDRPEDIRRCRALGARDYLRKPDSFDALQELCRRLEQEWLNASSHA